MKPAGASDVLSAHNQEVPARAIIIKKHTVNN
jgi:hypothetical protein